MGINAGTCEFGDYSGTPASTPVSILDGIKAVAGKGIDVKFAPWVSAADASETIAPEFFPKGLKAEYKKIIWPNRDDVTKQTVAVVLVSFVVGVIIAVLDIGLQYGIDFIINL